MVKIEETGRQACQLRTEELPCVGIRDMKKTAQLSFYHFGFQNPLLPSFVSSPLPQFDVVLSSVICV